MPKVVVAGWAASQFLDADDSIDNQRPFTAVKLAADDVQVKQQASLGPNPTASASEAGKIGVVPVGKPCDSFDATVQGPPDPILGVTLAFRADTSPAKIDGGVVGYVVVVIYVSAQYKKNREQKLNNELENHT